MQEVDIFIPCFVDQVYPEVGFDMIKLIKKAGFSVNYNPKQTCCGQLAFNSGYWDEARNVAKKFIHDFSGENMIVGPSASCIGMIRNYYPKLFHNTPLFEKAKLLGSRTFELTDFLVNKIRFTNFGTKFQAKVTYHDACAALREYGIKNEPRILLKEALQHEIQEMQDSDVCCGFGGTFSVKHEPISTAMAQQKVENAIASGAEYITSTEASCLLHLDGYIRKHNLPVKTIHIASILANGL